MHRGDRRKEGGEKIKEGKKKKKKEGQNTPLTYSKVKEVKDALGDQTFRCHPQSILPIIISIPNRENFLWK